MIDLMTARTAWEERQIDKRVVAMIRQRYSLNEEQLLSRILHGSQLGTYQLSPEEQAEVAAYQAHAEACRTVGHQEKVANEVLKAVLAYEQAARDVAELTLRIEGRAEVPAVVEVPEETDPVTGEVIQEYVAPVPAIPAVEPLATTLDTVDEQGNPVTINNLAYIEAVGQRDTAQAIIDSATAEVLGWVEQRR